MSLPLVAGAPGWFALAGLVFMVRQMRGMSLRPALLVGWAVGTAVWGVSTDWLMTALSSMGGASRALAAGAHLAHALWCGLPFGVLMAFLSRPVLWATPWRRLAAAVVGGLWLSWYPQPLAVPVTAGLAMDDRLLQWAALGAWTLPVIGLWFALTWTHMPGWASSLRAVVGMLLLMGVGQWRLLEPATDAASVDSGRVLRVAVLQPAVQPDTRDVTSRESVTALVTSSRTLLAREDSRADLLVWPELPIALSVTERESDRTALQALVRDTGVPLLVNGYARLDAPGDRYSNSSWLLMPDGSSQRYDKQVLVPFGEYLPELFTPLTDVFPGVKRYAPGSAAGPILLAGVRIGTPICFEALMPERLRAFKAAGAAVLINQGNDIWFQSSRAQRLHLAVARLRAVEAGVTVLRVFNTGYTVLIDHRGRLSGQQGEVDGLFEGVFEVPRSLGSP